MRNEVVAVALLAAIAWVSAPGAALAEPVRVAVYPFSGGSKLTADELSLLNDLIVQGLSELPQADYAVEAGAAPEGGEGKACDPQCELEAARVDGAMYVVAGDLKKLKGGTVMTVALFAVADGQVVVTSSSDLCPDLNALMDAARAAATALKEKLVSLIPPPPEPEPAAPPPAPVAPQGPAPGILKVATEPPGAQVFVGGSKREPGRSAGAAPVEIPLKAWSYWVTLAMPGYKDHRRKIDLGVGQVVELKVPMEVERWPALRVAAHATLWPGAALTLLGGVGGFLGWFYGDRYGEELDRGDEGSSRMWTTIMWVSGGIGLAMATAGVVLMVKWSKEPRLAALASDAALGVSPTADGGGVFAYRRRF